MRFPPLFGDRQSRWKSHCNFLWLRTPLSHISIHVSLEWLLHPCREFAFSYAITCSAQSQTWPLSNESSQPRPQWRGSIQNKCGDWQLKNDPSPIIPTTLTLLLQLLHPTSSISTIQSLLNLLPKLFGLKIYRNPPPTDFILWSKKWSDNLSSTALSS